MKKVAKIGLMVAVAVMICGNVMASTPEIVEKGNYRTIGKINSIKLYRENKFFGHNYVFYNDANDKTYVTKDGNVLNYLASLDNIGLESSEIQSLNENIKDDKKLKTNVGLGLLGIAATFAGGLLADWQRKKKEAARRQRDLKRIEREEYIKKNTLVL